MQKSIWSDDNFIVQTSPTQHPRAKATPSQKGSTTKPGLRAISVVDPKDSPMLHRPNAIAEASAIQEASTVQEANAIQDKVMKGASKRNKITRASPSSDVNPTSGPRNVELVAGGVKGTAGMEHSTKPAKTPTPSETTTAQVQAWEEKVYNPLADVTESKVNAASNRSGDRALKISNAKNATAPSKTTQFEPAFWAGENWSISLASSSPTKADISNTNKENRGPALSPAPSPASFQTTGNHERAITSIAESLANMTFACPPSLRPPQEVNKVKAGSKKVTFPPVAPHIGSKAVTSTTNLQVHDAIVANELRNENKLLQELVVLVKDQQKLENDRRKIDGDLSVVKDNIRIKLEQIAVAKDTKELQTKLNLQGVDGKLE